MKKQTLISAKVIEVNRNSYLVSDGKKEMPAELSGKFMFDAESPEDYPTVGDIVNILSPEENSTARIHLVEKRKTLLKRKEAGKRIRFQLIAANIDCGLVVQSANDINLNLLDRFFAMLSDSGIEGLAVFTKSDLLSPEESAELGAELSGIGKEYVLISNKDENGVEPLAGKIIPGKTYCLLGQSGVGKTSILNRLLDDDILKVGNVRETDGKGRHTTVKRQLLTLPDGSIFIDTPGIRELGNFGLEDGIEKTFDDLTAFAASCRFRNCTHKHEKDCAVLEAVNSGEIDESRYQNFLKLSRESEFYETSAFDRKRKDKTFGKARKKYNKLRGNLD
ncbi:MAG: ribosome small subunit-dependent GTPase A [Fibrobacterota bacterium]